MAPVRAGLAGRGSGVFMDLTVFIHSLSASGLFSARAFLPAFVTALLLRFGPGVPLLQDLPILQGVTGVPTWFTHDATLIGLGLLALAEILAVKTETGEEVLGLLERYLKPAMAVLCFLGVLSVRDRQVVEGLVNPGVEAGLGDGLWAVGSGLLVAWMTVLRARFREVFKAIDEDDDLGWRQLASWAEDLAVSGGLLVLVFYPLLMLMLLGVVLAVLQAASLFLDRRERRRRGACAVCGAALHRSALCCPGCGQDQDRPAAVGFFGQSLEYPAADRAALSLHLAEKRRCPCCATRLPLRRPRQACPGCGRDPFAEAAFRERYIAMVSGRLAPTLGLGFLCSLVPVVGLVPGVILCRQALTGPFSRYLPGGRRLLARWGLRLVFVVLLSIQWLPVLGGVVVPLIGALGFVVYRRAFVRLCRDGAAAAPSVTAAPSSVAVGAVSAS